MTILILFAGASCWALSQTILGAKPRIKSVSQVTHAHCGDAHVGTHSDITERRVLVDVPNNFRLWVPFHFDRTLVI
ncbi:hypothetical protein BJ165DRAFT_1438545, partial [Panaeolus papilionaceus]